MVGFSLRRSDVRGGPHRLPPKAAATYGTRSEVGRAHAQAEGDGPAGLGGGEVHAADRLVAGAGHAGEGVGDVGGESEFAGDVLAQAAVAGLAAEEDGA